VSCNLQVTMPARKPHVDAVSMIFWQDG
jgi:hypothetical protein